MTPTPAAGRRIRRSVGVRFSRKDREHVLRLAVVDLPGFGGICLTSRRRSFRTALGVVGGPGPGAVRSAARDRVGAVGAVGAVRCLDGQLLSHSTWDCWGGLENSVMPRHVRRHPGAADRRRRPDDHGRVEAEWVRPERGSLRWLPTIGALPVAVTGQPPQFVSGRRFESVVKADFALRGGADRERRVVEASGRRRRADVWVVFDRSPTGDATASAIFEVKSTDWNSIAPSRIRRDVLRMARTPGLTDLRTRSPCWLDSLVSSCRRPAWCRTTDMVVFCPRVRVQNKLVPNRVAGAKLISEVLTCWTAGSSDTATGKSARRHERSCRVHDPDGGSVPLLRLS